MGFIGKDKVLKKMDSKYSLCACYISGWCSDKLIVSRRNSITHQNDCASVLRVFSVRCYLFLWFVDSHSASPMRIGDSRPRTFSYSLTQVFGAETCCSKLSWWKLIHGFCFSGESTVHKLVQWVSGSTVRALCSSSQSAQSRQGCDKDCPIWLIIHLYHYVLHEFM